MATEMTKNFISVDPLSFEPPLLRNPNEHAREPYTTSKWTPWITFLLLIVWVYLLSNFRRELQKTHDLYSRVLNDRSRSSKVDDFRVN